MDTSALQARRPVNNDIESWDNDDDLQGIEDLHFRNISTTTVATNASTRGSQHRDSISSRISLRSDIEDEGDWQLLLPNDDELSTKKAIADAKDKGIPLPANVPTSALLGGTIKRLGGRRIKKAFGDDWNEDFEPSRPDDGGLKLKMNDGKEFPDALRQVSATTSQAQSPAKAKASLSFMERLQFTGQARASLDKFKDGDGDGDDEFGNVPTIKVAKSRTPLKMPAFDSSPVRPVKLRDTESFEDDFELPADGELKLSARKEIPRTPASQTSDDFDPDWAVGSQSSLGTSHGGRRAGKSNRSSSISALSPSVFSPSLSSCFTAESEDEGLGGLVLPDGPLKFQEALQKRLESASSEPNEPLKRTTIHSPTKEDFFSGIEIGDGDLFDSGKLTLNRNIKHKPTRLTSPTRRTATTLTFNKSAPLSNATTRIPKPAGLDRTRSKLEPVMESGAPVPSFRRTQSRLGGHSTQSSVTSIPTPTTSSFPSSSGPSTPSRRGLATRPSREAMRLESTTTSAQLLKAKRSMPMLSTTALTSPPRTQPSFQRPASRNEKQTRVTTFSRPKTPIDRSGPDSNVTSSRKPPAPFLSSSNVQSQSHHVSKKSSRAFHRPTSSDSTSNEAPSNRSISRLSNNHRPNTPPNRRDVAPESLARAAASKRTITKPLRRRAYGDGNELDVFDDLATSATAESKYVKQPVGASTKTSGTLRNKQLFSIQNQSSTSVSRTDVIPRTPLSPQKGDDSVPSWARDTAASRTAREQRIGNNTAQLLRQPSHIDHVPVTTNWKAQINAKPLHSHQTTKRGPKPQRRPHLIKPLNNFLGQEKDDKGMHWNPALCRWEGNEKALVPFDVLPSPKPCVSPATKPALIANVGSVKGVQVVGGMVFDPQRMCWLKMAPNSGRGRSESATISLTTEDDEEDPFAGLDDLVDETRNKQTDHTSKGMAGSDDEWMVGEEFDVGPEFVRRQKNEEEKWKRRLQGWKGLLVEPDIWRRERWAIRDLVRQLG